MGSDDAVAVAFVVLRWCFDVAEGGGVADGVIVGKRLLTLPGVTVVPGNPGTVLGSAGTVMTGAGELPFWPTIRPMLASAGDSVASCPAALPCTSTVTVSCSPTDADLAIRSVMISSMAW
jgi:hypothetical protein